MPNPPIAEASATAIAILTTFGRKLLALDVEVFILTFHSSNTGSYELPRCTRIPRLAQLQAGLFLRRRVVRALGTAEQRIRIRLLRIAHAGIE